jgi:hypothetical protein
VLKQFPYKFRVYITLFISQFICASLTFSEPVKARLNPSYDQVKSLKAFSLPSGGIVKISSTPQFSLVANVVSETVKLTHDNIEKLFGPTKNISVEVKLIPEDIFFITTQAPSWTNALYYNDVILIPVKKNQISTEDFKRSIRHEFSHAAIHSLSDGLAPGWIDEGLAQHLEGSAHPALFTALKKWVQYNPPVPLSMLQNGFTKLDTKYVVAAYAQSLWATRYIIGKYGYLKVRNYLSDLKSSENSFQKNFGISESQFEEELKCVLTDNFCLAMPEACNKCRKVLL